MGGEGEEVLYKRGSSGAGKGRIAEPGVVQSLTIDEKVPLWKKRKRKGGNRAERRPRWKSEGEGINTLLGQSAVGDAVCFLGPH